MKLTLEPFISADQLSLLPHLDLYLTLHVYSLSLHVLNHCLLVLILHLQFLEGSFLVHEVGMSRDMLLLFQLIPVDPHFSRVLLSCDLLVLL